MGVSGLSQGPRAQSSEEKQCPVSMKACHSSRERRMPGPVSTRVLHPWAVGHAQLCFPRPHDKKP